MFRELLNEVIMRGQPGAENDPTGRGHGLRTLQMAREDIKQSLEKLKEFVSVYKSSPRDERGRDMTKSVTTAEKNIKTLEKMISDRYF